MAMNSLTPSNRKSEADVAAAATAFKVPKISSPLKHDSVCDLIGARKKTKDLTGFVHDWLKEECQKCSRCWRVIDCLVVHGCNRITFTHWWDWSFHTHCFIKSRFRFRFATFGKSRVIHRARFRKRRRSTTQPGSVVGDLTTHHGNHGGDKSDCTRAVGQKYSLQ